MKKKSFKWGYAIFWGLAFLFLISIPSWFKQSFVMGLLCIVITGAFGFFGYKSFLKEWNGKKPEVEAAIKKATPKTKRKSYKGFDLEYFKVDNLEGCFIYNDEFDYDVSEIKENCLEDWPIYKFRFDLKPEFTRSESGNLRIMAKGRFIGDLSAESAAELKDFINSHEGCTPLLDIQGGEYRIYDSDENVVTKGRDPWTAKLLVQYYE